MNPAHFSDRLGENHAAVYIFECEGKRLATLTRNRTQGINLSTLLPDSCRSNLARFLLQDPNFQTRISCGDVGEWIRANTTRYNILIPAAYVRQFVHFAEAFFILKCCPRFEE